MSITDELKAIWIADDPRQEKAINQLWPTMAPLAESPEELLGLIEDTVKTSQVELSDDAHSRMQELIFGAHP